MSDPGSVRPAAAEDRDSAPADAVRAPDSDQPEAASELESRQLADALYGVGRSPIIVARNVNYRYPAGELALRTVNLTIRRGEFVFLVGSSGAGKTTLIHLLNRDLVPSSGSIYIDGVNTARLTRSEIPRLRRRVGVIFQDYKLLTRYTVGENVAFALRVTGGYDGAAQRRVREALATVSLADRANDYPFQLSGGEQQRVAIARCLVTKPPIVIADEPTGNLDPEIARETISLLLRISELGTTVIVATHNRELVNSLRQRVIELSGGRLARDEIRAGYTADLLDADAYTSVQSPAEDPPDD
ncbi:MAG: ATP-binding cassette domain-containing protein [Chloroflexota bacterium]|nr:ATP-binding cassette domain-containing protein [Chloroflexota bacterium]MDE2936767.1 ATP-binding cassette domain-containing protein [Chloroflexota bacterium]